MKSWIVWLAHLWCFASLATAPLWLWYSAETVLRVNLSAACLVTALHLAWSSLRPRREAPPEKTFPPVPLQNGYAHSPTARLLDQLQESCARLRQSPP